MQFSEFAKRLKTSLYGSPVVFEETFLGEQLLQTEDGRILVNGRETQLSNIEEAKQYIHQIKFEEEIAQELYEDIPAVRIATLIKEHHNIKVTNKIIESYMQLALSKTFSIDPVVSGIRAFNSLDSVIENKIDYVLNDGSIVAISEDTQLILNSLLEDKYQLVEYMQECKDNFMHVLKELS